jgi:hypothetical protein
VWRTCAVQPAWRPPPPVIRQDALHLKVLQHLQGHQLPGMCLQDGTTVPSCVQQLAAG